MGRELTGQMREAGVNLAIFRPPKPYAIRRLNNRTHRKLCIVDGRVGLIGGVGIADEWSGNAQDPDHWRDTHVRVRGPVVRGLQGAFAENWLEATGDVLVGPRYLPELEPLEGGCTMQLVRSSAGVGDTNIEALYFLAIACARERLHLTAAYFAPRPAFIEALCDAAERGVDVRLLVPGEHIDKAFVRKAGRGTYDQLLSCGVRIWEFCPTMLHAKTLTIDGGWTSIGSVNFDNRSFQLQDEATLCVVVAVLHRRARRPVPHGPRALGGDRARALEGALAARQGQRAGPDARAARAVTDAQVSPPVVNSPPGRAGGGGGGGGAAARRMTGGGGGGTTTRGRAGGGGGGGAVAAWSAWRVALRFGAAFVTGCAAGFASAGSVRPLPSVPTCTVASVGEKLRGSVVSTACPPPVDDALPTP